MTKKHKNRSFNYFLDFKNKIQNSRSFFFSSKEYTVHARKIEIFSFQIDLYFSEKNQFVYHYQNNGLTAIPSSKYKDKKRLKSLSCLPENLSLSEKTVSISTNRFRFGFPDYLLLFFNEIYTKIVWYNIFHMHWSSSGMKNTLRLIRFFEPFSKFVCWAAPELGFILSVSFIFSDMTLWFRLFESSSVLLGSPKVLFLRRLLSLSSLTLHFLALSQYYLPAICGPRKKALIVPLVIGGSLCWLGNYSTAINLALEGDFNYFKIKAISDSVNIVFENWVVKRVSFIIPVKLADILFKYKRRFVFKTWEKRYLVAIVNRIRAFEYLRNAYAFKNPFAIVDIRDYNTVLVTVLKLSNGKFLFLAGNSARIITNVLLIGDRAGALIASGTKYIP